MPDADPVAETLREMYAAATVDDLEALKAIFDDGFYAYDLGERYDGLALAEVLQRAHAAGRQFVWTVQDVESHVLGEWAWLAYVNRGSVSDGQTVTPVTWLESAVLRHDGSRWRIRFFHSTRAEAGGG
jgi:hypothetical protein